jgi:hypothetical protein
MGTNDLTKRTSPAPTTLAPVDPGRLLESIVTRGDLSGLSPADRARFYAQTCEEYGLNPASQPFAFLRLNGKEILYATRGATDQLAAIHRLNREIIDGPKVIDLAGTKLVYCVARATHPNGRIETATATVPLVDPVNVLMKAETKAKRRVTLSILGLGTLDEMELETIPASAQQPAPQVSRADLDAVTQESAEPAEPPPSNEEGPAPGDAEREERTAGILADYGDAVDAVELPGEATQVWLRYRAQLATLPASDREAAWKALCKRVEEVGKMKNAKVWLKKAIAEEDARRTGSDPGPLDDPPPAGGGAPSSASKSTTPATGAAARTSSGAGPVALLVAVPDWSRNDHEMAKHVAGYGLPLVVEAAVRKDRHTLGDAYLGLCALRLEALTPTDHHGARLTAEGARTKVQGWADEGPVRTQTGSQKRAGGRR